MTWEQKAVQRTKEILGAAYNEGLTRRLAVIRPVKGSESKFKRFARASDLEEMGDYNAEITFALIFVGLGFEVEFEPLGDKGRICWSPEITKLHSSRLSGFVLRPRLKRLNQKTPTTISFFVRAATRKGILQRSGLNY